MGLALFFASKRMKIILLVIMHCIVISYNVQYALTKGKIVDRMSTKVSR